MSHFLIPPGKKPGDLVALSAEESRHLAKVLRAKPGDRVRLTDGEGRIFEGEVLEVSPRRTTVAIREARAVPPPRKRLVFAQSLVKGDKFEFVLQKAVELGVAAFVPFVSSRTVVEWKRGPDKLKRWRRIAEEAAKQCGRPTRMAVAEPRTFAELVRDADADVKIVFWEESRKPFKDFARAVLDKTAEGTVLAVVGPEGGFSAEEIAAAKERGFAAPSLGPLVLRVDTAAVTAMGLVQYELGNI